MGRVQHVVILRLRSSIPAEKVQQIMDGVKDLKKHVPGYMSFSGGSYSSPEGLGKGFTHAFLVTFENEAARDTYLSHPQHEPVKQLILAELEHGVEDVLVFDWVEPD